MKYPRRLSSGTNNTVIVLSEAQVAKLFTGDTRSDIGSEAAKMQFANTVNDLIVQFVRLDYDEALQAEMLIMVSALLITGLMKWNAASCGSTSLLTN